MLAKKSHAVKVTDGWRPLMRDPRLQRSCERGLSEAGVTFRRPTELADIMLTHLMASRIEATTTKYLDAFKRWKTFIHAEWGGGKPYTDKAHTLSRIHF